VAEQAAGDNGVPGNTVTTIEYDGEKYALVSDVIRWLLNASDAIEAQTEPGTSAFAQAVQTQICREIAKRLGLSLLD